MRWPIRTTIFTAGRAIALASCALFAGCAEEAERPLPPDPGTAPVFIPPDATDPADDETEPQPPSLPETLAELADRMQTRRAALEQQRQARIELLTRRRVQLAQLTSDLQVAIRRHGQSIDEVLQAFRDSSPDSGPLAALHVEYRRCGQLRVHVNRLEQAIQADALLAGQLKLAEENARQQAELNAALDPEDREQALELLEAAGRHDPFSPDRPLQPVADLELENGLQAVSSSLRERQSLLPAETEQSLEDLPALPAMAFDAQGLVEQTVLASLHRTLQEGRAAAAEHLAAGRKQAAIDVLRQALAGIRTELAAQKNPPGWQDDCLAELNTCEKALTVQLATPYLTALSTAVPEAYSAREPAGQATRWSRVLDLLEELIRVAPETEALSARLREIDELLQARENLGSLEAAVARRRFDALRQQLDLPAGQGATRPPDVPSVIVPPPPTTLPQIGPGPPPPAPPALVVAFPAKGSLNAVLPLHTLSGHSSTVRSVAFSPDGRMLATGSHDRTARLWSVANGKLRYTLSGHSNSVHSVAFSPDGRLLATGSDDDTARLWSVADGQLRHTLSGHSSDVNSVSFSPDGRILATGSFDDTARLWSVADGQLRHTLSGHSSDVNSVSFSPDGRILATGSDDETARLWSVADGKPLRTLSGHPADVWSVAFSPDGRTLATGSDDHTARLWRLADGKPLHTLSGHSSFVFLVAFSPDGRVLATGSSDDTARLWTVADGKPLHTLSGHSESVYSVAFSPDGRILATGSSDKTARLWLLVRGRPEDVPDWSDMRPRLPPQPRATVTVAGGGAVYAGDVATVQLQIANTGKGDLVQFHAWTEQSGTPLDTLGWVYGRQQPGAEFRIRQDRVLIPADHPGGKLTTRIVFHERYGFTPAPQPLEITVLPLPRRDLPLEVKLTDGNDELAVGNGNGQFEPGEGIDVGVRILNRTGLKLEGLLAGLSFRAESPPAGVRLNTRSAAIDPLPQGDTLTVHLGVTLEKSATAGEVPLLLTISHPDGRTLGRREILLEVAGSSR